MGPGRWAFFISLLLRLLLGLGRLFLGARRAPGGDASGG